MCMVECCGGGVVVWCGGDQCDLQSRGGQLAVWESSLDPAELQPLEFGKKEKKKSKKKKEEEDEEDEVVDEGAEAEAEVMTADDSAAESRLVYRRAARHYLRDHLEHAQGTEVRHRSLLFIYLFLYFQSTAR